MRDLFTCMYCGRDLRGVSRREITLDHLRCRIDGGSNDSSNLITACLSCNSGRSAHTKWYKYATPGAVKRIRAHIRRRLNIQLAKDIIAGRANLDAETR